MSRILVLNATGNVSQGVVRGLAEAGHQVTAASRNPRASSLPNVRNVHFDYTDPSTFDLALDGVDRLFWLSPPPVLDGATYTRPFLERALTRVTRAVAMTASGVEHDERIPLRPAELLFERSGVEYVHLRPTWFSDNFHTFWVGAINAADTIALPAGDGASAFIDARDIGRSAVAALTRSDISNRAFTLTGPAALTYAQAAAILSRAAGRTIRYVPIEDSAFIEGAIRNGIAEPYAKLLVELFNVVRQGWSPPPTSDVEALTGRAPISLEACADQHAAAWRR